jgi:hypothetical protein
LRYQDGADFLRRDPSQLAAGPADGIPIVELFVGRGRPAVMATIKWARFGVAQSWASTIGSIL